MSNAIVKSIIHPTDFSPASTDAFVHAMRIALAARSELHLLHIDPPDRPSSFDNFPHVRTLLSAWGLMHENDPRADVSRRFGVDITKCDIADPEPVEAVVDYIEDHPGQLVVLGTEGRTGWEYLRKGSVAERIARKARKASLFVTAGARGIVDQSNGNLFLNRILLPIDHDTPWVDALNFVSRFSHMLNPEGVEIHLLHVGDQAPVVTASLNASGVVSVIQRDGPVVPTILEAADEFSVDMIAMPTAGHHGILDALRGSVTERVLHLARVPLLAVPAK